MVRVRFAPSPTGTLHLGSALSAAANRTFADEHGGTLLLRIDDTDPTRVVEGGEEAILADLEWLGIGWDEGPVRQSDRAARHREAAGAGRRGRGGRRRRAPLRQDDAAPGRRLSDLPARERRRRPRLRDHARDPRLRPSRQRAAAGRALPGAGRRAAGVHPPRAPARPRRAQALEAPRRGLGRRPARGGDPGRGGARLPRRARAAAPRRPPRPRPRPAARGRGDRGDERRVAGRAGRRAGRARARAARRARPRRGAGVGGRRSSRPSRRRCPRARP